MPNYIPTKVALHGKTKLYCGELNFREVFFCKNFHYWKGKKVPPLCYFLMERLEARMEIFAYSEGGQCLFAFLLNSPYGSSQNEGLSSHEAKPPLWIGFLTTILGLICLPWNKWVTATHFHPLKKPYKKGCMGDLGDTPLKAFQCFPVLVVEWLPHG